MSSELSDRNLPASDNKSDNRYNFLRASNGHFPIGVAVNFFESIHLLSVLFAAISSSSMTNAKS